MELLVDLRLARALLQLAVIAFVSASAAALATWGLPPWPGEAAADARADVGPMREIAEDVAEARPVRAQLGMIETAALAPMREPEIPAAAATPAMAAPSVAAAPARVPLPPVAPRRPPQADAATAPPPDSAAARRLRPDDPPALTSAHIARLKAVLRLTPAQQQLWPPVEAALRDIARHPEAFPAEARAFQAAAGNGEIAIDRERMQRLAMAAWPLIMSLDETQKRDAVVLAKSIGLGGVLQAF
jgi:hypothetical protein